MRVLVTVTPGLKELLDDLKQVPTRYRSERLKALAYSGLKAQEASGHVMPPVEEAEPPAAESAKPDSPAPSLGMSGSNDAELFDDSD